MIGCGHDYARNALESFERCTAGNHLDWVCTTLAFFLFASIGSVMEVQGSTYGGMYVKISLKLADV